MHGIPELNQERLDEAMEHINTATTWPLLMKVGDHVVYIQAGHETLVDPVIGKQYVRRYYGVHLVVGEEYPVIARFYWRTVPVANFRELVENAIFTRVHEV